MAQLTEEKTTPMMAQWHECKARATEALLLFRLGDFYEAFYEDAHTIAKELELTLTQRQGIAMAGIPWHCAQGYIDRLVAKGHRVAIAEQTEDPKQTKKLVRREVVRVITPATTIDSSLVGEKKNNFFVALHQVNATFGLAVLDLSTGHFLATEFTALSDLVNELARLFPSELLLSTKFKEQRSQLLQEIQLTINPLLTVRDEWHFDHQNAYETLVNHFKLHSLDGLGLLGMGPAINAAGALLHYLSSELCLKLTHLLHLLPYSSSAYVTIDRMTQRNLELTESLSDRGRKQTLLYVMDRTCTPMGGRLLHQWIKQPLLSIEEISQRQEAIETLKEAGNLASLLEQVRDLERLSTKICCGYASARDLVSLKRSLKPLPSLIEILNKLPSHLVQTLAHQIDPLQDLFEKIEVALVEEPPLRLGEGTTFRKGFHPPLDELCLLQHNAKGWVGDYQAKLRNATGIKTLKVGFNRIFGYYIEISKGQAQNAPSSFERRQTLANCERFTCSELKEHETKIFHAQERLAYLENELFTQLRCCVAQEVARITKTAHALANIDCLNSLADLAKEKGYVKPLIDNCLSIEIEGGRHPVIESLHAAHPFIPNDTHLNATDHQLIILTGPNMAGKSTYIRQVALITLMAQMGSFVPAQKARIGVVDKIFTRIGASDDLSRGQSTFMVEMAETANILNNATARSLVILDEIGRGTSTYDGISIAWAVAEYLLTIPQKRARTLFATHYYELTELEEKVLGAINYNVVVHESGQSIVFFHKIARGSADKSYGIHVARLAGLPPTVLGRAQELLTCLEKEKQKKNSSFRRKADSSPPSPQLTFF